MASSPSASTTAKQPRLANGSPLSSRKPRRSVALVPVLLPVALSQHWLSLEFSNMRVDQAMQRGEELLAGSQG